MISVIIPNFNGEKYLGPCLTSLEEQIYQDFEVIVIDNASIDNSVEVIRSQFPRVTLQENESNRGYAGGCNDGAEVATGDYLLFLNTDTVLHPSVLSILAEATIRFSDYGMYAPKMVYPDGRINSTGLCISLSGAAWDRGMSEEDCGQYNASEDILGPCGGAALFRREAFVDAGGFDEDFFLYMEDVDLVIRTQRAGWKCRYIPEAVVYHHHGGTAGRASDLSLYYLHRNSIWFFLSNFPIFLLTLSFPLFFIRNVMVVIFYLCIGRGQVVLQAKIDAIRGLPKVIEKRKMRRHIFLPRSLPLHIVKSVNRGDFYKRR